MPENLRRITAEDILPLDKYEAGRAESRQTMVAYKRGRQVHVGPYALFMFESYHSMLYQVHEMLAIERGGKEQLPDELAAYNPMIPQGDDLSATVMLQIEDEALRRRVLAGLGGIEDSIILRFGGMELAAVAEADVDRTSSEGKASSVQFVHFYFDAEQKRAFINADEVLIGFTHPHYAHLAILPQAVHAELIQDFA